MNCNKDRKWIDEKSPNNIFGKLINYQICQNKTKLMKPS